jgi:hypothetical protein
MVASVTKRGALDMQVCVPSDWSDEQATQFGNRESMAGTENGWVIRTADDPAQRGAPTRVQCASLQNHVHIMLTC